MKPTLSKIGLALLLALAGQLSANVAGAEPGTIDCLDGSPAFPVPEFRNGTRLWHGNFSPARPGVQIPAGRDSTAYDTFGSTPGAGSGFELFTSVEVAENFLFAAYNSGFQIWNIAGAAAEDPVKLAFRDGWQGHFIHFETLPTEFDLQIWDIDVVRSGNDMLIVVAGNQPAGLSVWLWKDRKVPITPSDLIPVYQEIGRGGYQARAVDINGRQYAFFATSNSGVHAYDLTRAKEFVSGCEENTTVANLCSGVHQGRLGSSLVANYLDTIKKGNDVYVAFTDSTPPNPLGLELWKVRRTNPNGPALTSELKFSGLHSVSRGVALFQHPTTNLYYLGVKNFTALEIYDITGCLDAAGTCTSLGTRKYMKTLGLQAPFEYLTYSASGNTPYLFYGFQHECRNGTGIEMMLDVSGINNGVVTNITQTGAGGGGGGTVTDTVNGQLVDYWGSYYDGNTLGYGLVTSRIGKYNGSYFYRAAFSLLDVHKVGNGPPQGVATVGTTAATAGPYYYDQPITFNAAAQNCTGQGEGWIWSSENTNASGLGLASTPNNIRWNFCTSQPCPTSTFDVWAVKQACAGDNPLVIQEATITLEEPRPFVTSLHVDPPGSVYPAGTVLGFSASVVGRPPLTYSWRVLNGLGQVVVPPTAGTTFTWADTCFDPEPPIFVDGFESGDVSAWSGTGSGAPPIGGVDHLAEGGEPQPILGADYTVELTLDNAPYAPHVRTLPVTLLELGNLAFGPVPITVTPPVPGGEATFTFQANSLNATEWRWEFPQTNAAGQPLPPVIVDWGVGDQVQSFTWAPPNVAGVYLVKVSIRNCQQGQTPPTSPPITATVPVTITTIPLPDPPVVTSFRVGTNPASVCPECTGVGACFCNDNVPINFIVTSTGEPLTYEFDWNEDGTFEQQISVGSPITHVYTTTGHKDPKVRAVKGTQVSPQRALETDLFIQ